MTGAGTVKLTDRKRQAILDAALEEFREQGFLGARTGQIARRAGVSSRTLYKHFASKEALFDAICEIMLARSRSVQPLRYDPARPLAPQLTEVLRRYVAVMTDDNTIGLSRVVMTEMLRDLDRARHFSAEVASLEGPVTRLVAEAMEAGALRPGDPARAGGHLLGLVKNAYFWPKFLLDQPVGSEDLLQDCVALFMAHYATPPQHGPGAAA
jgi:TetR/AcrR family transcriptional regulator of autoinduction and epiphytic fitness